MYMCMKACICSVGRQCVLCGCVLHLERRVVLITAAHQGKVLTHKRVSHMGIRWSAHRQPMVAYGYGVHGSRSQQLGCHRPLAYVCMYADIKHHSLHSKGCAPGACRGSFRCWAAVAGSDSMSEVALQVASLRGAHTCGAADVVETMFHVANQSNTKWWCGRTQNCKQCMNLLQGSGHRRTYSPRHKCILYHS